MAEVDETMYLGADAKPRAMGVRAQGMPSASDDALAKASEAVRSVLLDAYWIGRRDADDATHYLAQCQQEISAALEALPEWCGGATLAARISALVQSRDAGIQESLRLLDKLAESQKEVSKLQGCLASSQAEVEVLKTQLTECRHELGTRNDYKKSVAELIRELVAELEESRKLAESRKIEVAPLLADYDYQRSRKVVSVMTDNGVAVIDDPHGTAMPHQLAMEEAAKHTAPPAQTSAADATRRFQRLVGDSCGLCGKSIGRHHGGTAYRCDPRPDDEPEEKEVVAARAAGIAIDRDALLFQLATKHGRYIGDKLPFPTEDLIEHINIALARLLDRAMLAARRG